MNPFACARSISTVVVTPGSQPQQPSVRGSAPQFPVDCGQPQSAVLSDEILRSRFFGKKKPKRLFREPKLCRIAFERCVARFAKSLKRTMNLTRTKNLSRTERFAKAVAMTIRQIRYTYARPKAA